MRRADARAAAPRRGLTAPIGRVALPIVKWTPRPGHALRFCALMFALAGTAAAVHAGNGGGAISRYVVRDAAPGLVAFQDGARAYLRHDYAFAVDRFSLAAHWGYKLAQYNLGLMYFQGLGMPTDKPRGLAWLALAAERGDPAYVDAREHAYAQMSIEEFARANVIWRELRRDYGDSVALRRAERQWRDTLRQITGSRLGFIGNLAIVRTEYEPVHTGYDVYRALQAYDDPEQVLHGGTIGKVEVGDLIPLAREVPAQKREPD